MKTAQLNKSLRLIGTTITIALFAALTVGNISAETPTGKGGARLLLKPDAPTAKAEQQAMSCTRCKYEFVTRKDQSVRGANKPDLMVARHLCGNCDTRIMTAGQGKAKHDVATHTCTEGAIQNHGCCNRPL